MPTLPIHCLLWSQLSEEFKMMDNWGEKAKSEFLIGRKAIMWNILGENIDQSFLTSINLTSSFLCLAHPPSHIRLLCLWMCLRICVGDCVENLFLLHCWFFLWLCLHSAYWCRNAFSKVGSGPIQNFVSALCRKSRKLFKCTKADVLARSAFERGN